MVRAEETKAIALESTSASAASDAASSVGGPDSSAGGYHLQRGGRSAATNELQLGRDIHDKNVWGIDCYTRRCIELVLADCAKEAISAPAASTCAEPLGAEAVPETAKAALLHEKKQPLGLSLISSITAASTKSYDGVGSAGGAAGKAPKKQEKKVKPKSGYYGVTPVAA